MASMAAVESVADTPPIQPPLRALRRRWVAAASAQDGPDAHLALAQDAEEALGPLDGLGQVAALHERPTTHQLLGLGEGPVDDRVLAILQADPGALRRGGDATGGDDDAGLGRLFDEPAHLLVQVGGRGLGRGLRLVGQGVSQESHGLLRFSSAWAALASL